VSKAAAPLPMAHEGMDHLSLTVLGAGAIGNILEWYDFGLYGLFAPLLAHLFFTAENRIAALMSVYAGFAIGFVMRPIGGAVLGHLGDRIGRRFVLICSVVMMGITTTAMGLLPTYGAIGIGAPILLLLLRILQGFSVGGEFTGSVAYLVESAPQHRRGLAGSFANIGSTIGLLLASGLAAAATTFAHPALLQSWGWRIPFLFGGVIAACGFVLRARLGEDDVSKPPASSRQRDTLPLKRALTEAPRAMFWTVLFTSGYGIVNYLSMVFLPTYASTFGGIAESHALQINTAAQALALVVVPLAGWLSDRAIRRRTLLILVFIAEFGVAWIFFALAHSGGTTGFWLAQLSFGALLALVMGSAPAMLSEQFKSDYRLSGYSLCFNIGIGIAGGTAPVIATWLIERTGSLSAPAFYLMLASAGAAVAAYMLVDRSREPLP
jgi:MHS family proline/betaine transporter-like MFS transporter